MSIFYFRPVLFPLALSSPLLSLSLFLSLTPSLPPYSHQFFPLRPYPCLSFLCLAFSCVIVCCPFLSPSPSSPSPPPLPLLLLKCLVNSIHYLISILLFFFSLSSE
uniref:Uncharacterized protein n=1 Tax=Cacopsylla melanoneura TaxID=428564 RepID=A0A8D9F371_9HEMI